MSFLKYVIVFLAALVITACGGGGGGSSGSSVTSSTSSGATTVTSLPTITLSIVNASYAVVTTNAIGSGAVFYIQATVKDASQGAVVNKLVTFTTDSAVATLAQASALTNVDGVARVQIQPVSLTAANAASLIASSKVDTVAVSTSLDYQTSAANVTLTNMQVSPSSIGALQSATVTVEGRVNGALAGGSVVTVSFSNPCGTFNPTSAPTNSFGIASTIYQSSAGVGCTGGNQTLTAQAAGAPSVTTTVNVTAAQPANVVYSSATVPLMVSSAAIGGIKQSTLKFQVLDSSGSGMTTQQNLSISLSPSTISAGVKFVGGSISPQPVTTDGSGYASVTVTSGGVPTPVIVTATLVGVVPVVQASSTGVAVTSGRATQNAASLSANKLSIEGFAINGAQSTLTMRVADRQGNPVPAGSIVTFVTGYGLVQGTCALDINSQCSVTYTSQGIRPSNGRVAILAYMDGEESFIDLNGDNIWHDGTNGTIFDPFYPVGLLYRDDNENSVYDSLTEQIYLGGVTGRSACANDVYSYPSVANSCDNTTWSGDIRVRQQIVIALSTSESLMSLATVRTSSGFKVRVTDLNGNAMPTGTTITAVVLTSGATCKVVGAVSPNAVRNSPNGGLHEIFLDAAADCLAVKVNVTATTPGGVSTTVTF